LLSLAMIVCAVVWPGRASHAGCNVVPFGLTAPVARFHSMRGAMTAPFLIPYEEVSIVRRACDAGTKFPAVADARIVVMVQPPVGRTRALVLKQQSTDGPCAAADPFAD